MAKHPAAHKSGHKTESKIGHKTGEKSTPNFSKARFGSKKK